MPPHICAPAHPADLSSPLKVVQVQPHPVLDGEPYVVVEPCCITVDVPSRLDPIALAAVRAADMVICPTLPDLLNLAPLRDTVALIETADKLGATVGVINDVDESGAVKKIAHAAAVLEKFKMVVSPAVIYHLPQFSNAYDKGMGVTEIKPRETRNRSALAPPWVAGILAPVFTSRSEDRPPPNRAGTTDFDPAHDHREPTVGSAEDSGGTGEAFLVCYIVLTPPASSANAPSVLPWRRVSAGGN
jgi:hypothetical protein